MCVRALSPVCLLSSALLCSAQVGAVRTGSATVAFCRASGAGKTAFTRRDGHRVGDGDALPGGRERGRGKGREGCRDAEERRGPDP